MKNFFATFTLLGLIVSLHAQQLDNPTTVQLSYYASAPTNPTGTSTITIGPRPDFPGDGVAPASDMIVSTDLETVSITPGKEYDITIDKTNCGNLTINFQPLNGEELYLNGVRRTSLTEGASSYLLKLRVERINDITSSLAGKRGGECSSFPEDKPIWYIGLGSLRNGRFAGAVGFRMPTITSDLFNTSSLIPDSVDVGEVTVTRDGGGYITQIQSRDVVLEMDPYNASGTSYSVRAYMPNDMNAPFITYTISSYNGGAGVRVDKVEDGVTWSTALQLVGSSWTRYDWQQSSVFPAGNITTTTVSGATSTVDYGSGSGMIEKQKTYSGGELATATFGPGLSLPQTNAYTYYPSSAGNGWADAIESITDPTGKWVKYDYYNAWGDTRAGQISKIYRPWLDAPTTYSTANTTNCLVASYDYAANFDGALTAPASREVSVNGTTVAKTTWTYNWAYTTANSLPITQTVRNDFSSSSDSLTTTILAYSEDEDDADTYFRGKLHSVTRPDGTKDAYAYFNGTWNASTNVFSAYAPGGARQMLIFHGQATAGAGGTAVSSWNSWTLDTVYLVPNLSTVTEIVVNTNGQLVFSGENVYTGGSNIERIAAQANTFDLHNRRVVQKDLVRSVPGGDVAVNFAYNAGLMTSKTGVDGAQTVWTYDDYLRNVTLTTAYGGSGSYPAKTQTFTYYNSNLKYTAQECSCAPGVVTTYVYDSAGRVTTVSEPKPNGGTLDTTYSYPSARETQITLPTGATKITDLYYDGRVKSETGDGQVDTRYGYAYDSSYVYKTTQHGATTANGWIEEKTDWLGRPVTQRAPQVGWTSGSSKVVRKTYNYSEATGQLLSLSTTDENAGSAKLLPDHIYQYGDLGWLTAEGDDVNGDGLLNDTSNDRLTTYTRSYLKETSGYLGWLRHDLAQVRTTSSSSAVATVVDRTTRLTQFNGGSLLGSARVLSDVVDLDSSGRDTSTWEWVDPAARTRTRYVSQEGASQNALTVWQDGYLKSEQSIGGVTKTYTYNDEGQMTGITEGTTNAATTYSYFPSTKYLSSATQTIGASTTTTTNYTYAWNTGSHSRTVTATDQAGNASNTEYDALDLPWHIWGAAVQPTLYTYDSYGRRTNLTTWQTGSFTGTTWPGSPGAGNVVTWNLDPATGAVTSKIYPDSSSVGFTYNARGQTKTRTWARTPTVTTTYNYFDSSGNLTGELQNIDYSDSTPDVSFTYTRFGALATVADAAGTRTFNYRSDLKLDNETFGAFYNSKVLTMTYDTTPPGRPTGWSFNGSSTVGETIGYDGATGRPSTIGGGLGGSSTTFALGYAGGTDLESSVTNGSYTRSTPLVSRYDVVASATTSWSGNALGSFTASYTDNRGWRNGHSSGSSGGTPAGSWSKLLNLGDGVTASFSFDGSGELTGEPSPSWQNAAGTADLGVRTWGWSYDLAGNRLTETNLSPTQTTSYAADSLNRYSSITGLRAEPTYSYDADGNLTQDGTWTYSYDAENRLISVTKSGQTLNFVYDYLGRRIRKTVTGTGAVDLKFLWNGWTLAAELQADGSTIVRSYIWGPDQSGGGGHHGALLGTYNAAGSLSYAMPDALGNIVGYLNSSGAIAAAVEYSPVGKGLNVYLNGATLSDYPIGFSGEYMDWETGTVYYGLRYYAPKHGRFLNRDPIEETGGNNLYGFVGNDPVNAWDHLGMVGIDIQKTKAQDSSGGGDVSHEPPVVLSPFEVHESRTDWQNYAGVTDIQDDALRDNDLQGQSGGGSTATMAPTKAPNNSSDCAKLKARVAIAQKIYDSNASKISLGGEFAGGVDVSKMDLASIANAATGLGLGLHGLDKYFSSPWRPGRFPWVNIDNQGDLRGIGEIGKYSTYAAIGIDLYQTGAAIHEGDTTGAWLSGANVGADTAGLGLAAIEYSWTGPVGAVVLGTGQLAVNAWVFSATTADKKESLKANADNAYGRSQNALNTLKGINQQMKDMGCPP